MRTRGIRNVLAALLLAAAGLAGCAVNVAVERAQEQAAAGNWDEAVRFYLEALAQDRGNVEARSGLIRATFEASQGHLRRAQDLEKAGELDEALGVYRRALSYDGENTLALEGVERIGRRQQARDLVAKARELLEKGAAREAAKELGQAQALDPDNAEARTLLKEAAEKLGPEGEAAKKREPEDRVLGMFGTKPVTLRFKDTDIKDVLEVFAKTAGVNIFTDEALTAKKITTFFKDLPLREAFNLILASNRLFAKRVAENTVIVVPDNPAKRQQYDELMVQTFYLTNADAKVTVNLLRTILNTRQVFVNEKLNALVVRETPEKIALARKLLEANDRGVGEVEIDLEVLEVDRARLENLGIDLQPRSYQVTLNVPQTLSINAAIFRQIRRGGVLTVTNPSLILNLAKNDSATKVLANPTVRVLDRQKARVLIGERRPFQISSLTSVPATAGTATTTPTGAVTTTESRVEFRDVGLKLTLTPTIHLNGEVTVELNFEISTVGAPIAGVANSQLLPPVNTRNLDTFIKVRNGETRVLGGLIQDTESEANSRVPLLSDIPLLGRLFVSGDRSKTRTDVLISLTPRIVKMLERPAPEAESFLSGTAESFGPTVPAPPAAVPPPVAPPPRPAPPAAPPPPGAPPAPG